MNALTAFAGDAFRWVLHNSWQAAVLAALVLVVQFAFRKKLSPSWRYGLWALVVVRLLMPASPQSAISVFNLAKLAPVKPVVAPQPRVVSATSGISPEESPLLGAQGEGVIPEQPAPTARAEPDAASEPVSSPTPRAIPARAGRSELKPRTDWFAVACCGWLLGVFLLGARLIWGSLRFRSRLGQIAPVVDVEVTRLAGDCADKLGVRQRVSVVETGHVESPAICGLWRRRLLLPKGIFERFSPHELRHIFLHELAHVKRRDLELNWLTGLLLILHWFNPLLWLAFDRMRADRELATDELALARSRESEAAGYGETILKVVEGLARRPVHAGLVGIAESKARVKERLVAIVNHGSRRTWRWAAIGLAILLAGIGLTGAQQNRNAERGKTPEPAANSQEGSLLSDESSQPTAEKQFVLRVLDFDSAKPLSGVTVSFTLDPFGAKAKKQVELTDKDGRAAIGYSPSNLKRLAYEVHKTNYLTLHGEWFDQQLALLDRQFEIKLSRGKSIGGTVIDERGRPVAGAKVSFDQPMNMLLSAGSPPYVDTAETWRVPAGEPVATTDAKGHWSARCIWPAVQWASLRVHHPDYADATCSTELTSAMQAEGRGVKVSFDDLTHDRVVLKLTKGVAVNGRVLDEAGDPVSGIQVNYAELWTSPHASDRLLGERSVTTDAAGKFELEHVPQKHLFFFVQTPGNAPAVAELDPEPSGSQIELRLEKGIQLKGQVEDAEGNAVVGAHVTFAEFGIWRGIHWEAISDEQGGFEWGHAPKERFALKVEKDGFIARQQFIRATDVSDVKIVLQRALHLTGEVRDAVTKKPVTDFQVDWLDRSDPRDFQRGYRYCTIPGSNGVYSLDLGRLYADTWLGGYAHDCVFRVRAEGYAPEVSRVFSSRNGDVGNLSYDVELTPVSQLSGVVVDTNGQPVANAQVALALQPSDSFGPTSSKLMLNGEPFFNPAGASLFKTTDDQGRFRLNQDPAATGVIAVHQDGFARAAIDEHTTNLIVRLQPWGGIEGTAWEYDHLVTNQSIWAGAVFDPNDQALRVGLRTNSDDRGQFEWNYVPPGKYRVYRMIPMTGGGAAGGPDELVEVKAGKTSTLKLGGEGRRVIGRFKIKNPYVAIDWASSRNMKWVRTVTPRAPAGLKTREEYNAWRKRPEIARAFENARNYPVQFAADGSFHIDEMLPGTYVMQVQLLDPRDPDAMAYSKYIGQFSESFEVPTNSSTDGKPLDIGTFEVSLKPQLVNGETPAPAFEATDMDGKKFSLADFRGKYVLLDFWATWCGPCIGEIPYLKQVHEKFKDRKDFAMISLSLDKTIKEPREFLKKNPLPWAQGYLGDWSGTDVPGLYGVDGIPAVFLVSPEGKIIESGLEGSSMVARLERHLK